MSSEPIDIKVKFTIKGLESLKRQTYMRPTYYEIDKENRHIYTFHYSKVQIINYLFKFGWDAEVLEPEDLRNEVKTRYKRALLSYEGKSKEEIFDLESLDHPDAKK